MKAGMRLYLAIILCVSLAACGGGGGDDNPDGGDGSTGTLPRGTLPDTGQAACYDASGGPIDCAGTGQDGEYPIIPMAFTNNPDGTVTDNVTGLMWQKCSAGQTNNATCSGVASPHNWYEAMGIYNAVSNPGPTDVCGSLDLGNHNDWRLPTQKELMGIVDYGKFNPAIDTAVFPNTYAGYYQTSAESASTPALFAWTVSFYNGYVGSYSKDSGYRVRCVRRGSSQAQSLKDNGDGTVTDGVTGLMWQKCSAGQTDILSCSSGAASIMSWQQALDYCNALTLGGLSWRLPNIKELESITDDTAYAPAIEGAAFPNTASDYWSSTTYADPLLLDYAWYVYFEYGTVNAYQKVFDGYSVRCVR